VELCDSELTFVTICPSRRDRSTPFLEWYMSSSSLFAVAYTVAMQIDGGSYMTSLDGGSVSAVRFLSQALSPGLQSLVTAAMSQFRPLARSFRHMSSGTS
jgi:hypothetical protein